MKKYCTSDVCPIINKSICCLFCEKFKDNCKMICDTAQGINDKLVNNCHCLK